MQFPIDNALFHNVVSAYHAVVLSASSPVVVPSDINISSDLIFPPFSHIYYDCTEDEKRGIEIMKERKKAKWWERHLAAFVSSQTNE